MHFFAVIIAIKGSCNKLDSLPKMSYRWQILHTKDNSQIVMFNIEEYFYDNYAEDFLDKYKIYDSIEGDILIMSDSNLLHRSFDTFDSSKKCYKRNKSFENVEVKYSSFSLHGDEYLVFYSLKSLIGLYHVDRIQTFEDYYKESMGVLIFLDRIINLPYMYPLKQE
ncbi:MAG: hypothetical protein IPN26_12855 [Bacteroidetes bacterium]|nr:hypothetical protein [Bacteroidota bacterium]